MSSTRTTRPGRLRWLAAGTAATVALGAGATTWQVTATSGGDDSTFVPVTPTRILDTRVDLGLDGPFTSPQPRQLTVTGQIPTADGTQTVVPTHANGVALNVTAVQPTAAGFISVRPGDATGAPTTSSLNFDAGDTTPNAVTVSIPTTGTHAGTIDITYDAYGQPGFVTDILIDVVGYTTTAGLDTIVAELAQKANTDDVIAHGRVQVANGHRFSATPSAPGLVTNFIVQSELSGNGQAQIPITGTVHRAGVTYDLTAVEYCIREPIGDAVVIAVRIYAADGTVAGIDAQTRDEAGCYETDVDPVGADAYTLVLTVAGDEGDDIIAVHAVRSTWEPVG